MGYIEKVRANGAYKKIDSGLTSFAKGYGKFQNGYIKFQDALGKVNDQYPGIFHMTSSSESPRPVADEAPLQQRFIGSSDEEETENPFAEYASMVMPGRSRKDGVSWW